MARLRVTGGDSKGRRLRMPKSIRPTQGIVKEAIFNLVASRVEGARVVDLFAGSGALGIEALSRGAAHVTFVDSDARAQALVEANLARCGVSDGYAIIRASVVRACTSFHAGEFDIVFLDPPYAEAEDRIRSALECTAAAVAADGLVILEHARRRPAPGEAGRLSRVRVVESGDSALTFFACQP